MINRKGRGGLYPNFCRRRDKIHLMRLNAGDMLRSSNIDLESIYVTEITPVFIIQQRLCVLIKISLKSLAVYYDSKV